MMVISLRWGNSIAVFFCLMTVGAIVWMIAGASYGISGTIATYPNPVVAGWVLHLKHLILLSSVLLAFVGSSVWAATRDGNICVAALILCLYGLALAISVIYCQLTARLLSKASNISIQDIKIETIEEFSRHGDNCYEKEWIPKWLDVVQEHSKSCCGIESFEDWKEFRPKCPTEFPRSCCQKSSECITNAGEIDWPATLDDHIKKDGGCGSVMIKQINDKIRFSARCMLGVSISIVLTLLAFLVKYTREYIIERRKGDAELEAPEDPDNPVVKRPRLSVSCLAGVWCRMRRHMTNTRPLGFPREGGDATGNESVGLGKRSPSGDEHVDRSYNFSHESEQSIQPKGSRNDGGVEGRDVLDKSNEKSPSPGTNARQQPQKSIASRFDALRNAPSRLFNSEEGIGREITGSRSLSTHSLISEDEINFVNKIQIQQPVQGVPKIKGLFPEERERPTLKQLLKFGKLARKRKKSQSEGDENRADFPEGE